MAEHPDPKSVEPSAAFQHLVSIRGEVQSAIAERRYGEAQEICDEAVAWVRTVEDWHVDDRGSLLVVVAEQAAFMLDAAIVRMVNEGDLNQARIYLGEVGQTALNLAQTIPMAAMECAHKQPSWDGKYCIAADPCPPED